MIGRWTMLQVAFTLFITTAPMWLDRAVANDNTYAYLFSPPYVWQLWSVIVFAVFTPQIALIIRNLASRSVSTVFYASYQVIHNRRISAVIYFPIAVFFFMSVASFIQGSASYALSVAREIKYHREIGRQNLVKRVKEEAKAGGEASSETLQRILDLYPGDIRNVKIERRLESIKAAKQTSALLLEKTERFASVKQDRLAIEFARASLDAWPYNKDAKRLLVEYRTAFDAMKPGMKNVYIYCNSATDANLQELVSKASLLFRDSQAVLAMINKKQDLVSSQRLRSQICSQALKVSDADQFLRDIRIELFGADTR